MRSTVAAARMLRLLDCTPSLSSGPIPSYILDIESITDLMILACFSAVRMKLLINANLEVRCGIDSLFSVKRVEPQEPWPVRSSILRTPLRPSNTSYSTHLSVKAQSTKGRQSAEFDTS